MFCSKCGSENEDTSNFCKKCSHPLNANAAAAQQVQPPPLNPQPPVPTRATGKKHTVRTVLITVVCLIVAFVLWVEFSPDVPASGANTTTAATTAAAAATTVPATAATTAASTKPAATTAAPTKAPTKAPAATTTAKPVTAVNTESAALKLVSQLTGKTNLEFLREEDFIANKDGTLSIDVNTPEKANATCFVISPKNDPGDGYENCYMVLKGTTQVYKPKAGGDGILVKMN